MEVNDNKDKPCHIFYFYNINLKITVQNIV
jgi:hypothetical protein